MISEFQIMCNSVCDLYPVLWERNAVVGIYLGTLADGRSMVRWLNRAAEARARELVGLGRFWLEVLLPPNWRN
jgi:hypothetical protein